MTKPLCHSFPTTRALRLPFMQIYDESFHIFSGSTISVVYIRPHAAERRLPIVRLSIKKLIHVKLDSGL